MPFLGGFYSKCLNVPQVHIFFIWATPVGIKPLTPRRHFWGSDVLYTCVGVICRSLPLFSSLSSTSTYHCCLFFYSPHSSIFPSSPLLSSFLRSSPSIRKHSGLMVEFKLRYKVIRQWMHFWLWCAFTMAQDDSPSPLQYEPIQLHSTTTTTSLYQ